MVVDQRAGATGEVRRGKGALAGYVLIFPRDGGRAEILIHDQPKDAVERLLAEIVSGAFATATELAKAARDALGRDASITTQPTEA